MQAELAITIQWFKKMLQGIIGISLGTRSIGIVVIRKGQLVNWQVKSFREKMNQQKLHMISGAVLKFIRENNSNTVILKMPHRDHTYATISLLKKHLLKSLITHGISVHVYSLSDIKAGLDISIFNKQDLLKWGC